MSIIFEQPHSIFSEIRVRIAFCIVEAAYIVMIVISWKYDGTNSWKLFMHWYLFSNTSSALDSFMCMLISCVSVWWCCVWASPSVWEGSVVRPNST